MFKSILIAILGISVMGCGSGNSDTAEGIGTPENFDLLTQLGDTTWVSNSCNRAYGNEYSKHEISFNELSLDYQYSFYDEGCMNVVGTYSISKSYTIGDQVITDSGVVSNQFNVVNIVNDLQLIFSNLIYFSNGSLYLQGQQDCMHKYYENVTLSELIDCTNIPNDFDYEHYYTRKI